MIEYEQQPEFPGQRAGEEVVFILFKHWSVLAKQILKAGLIILLSLAIPIWFGFAPVIFQHALTTISYYGWHVFWIGYMVIAYLTWFKDRFILTTERIINIDQTGLWSRKVHEIELIQVQHVSHEVRGLLATILNFGHITIQASGAPDLVLDDIAEPAEVQEDVKILVKENGTNQPLTATELIKLIKSTHNEDSA